MYSGLSHIRTDAHVVTKGNQGIYVPTGTEWIGVPGPTGRPVYRIPAGQLAITDRQGRILDPTNAATFNESIIKLVVGSGSNDFIYSSSQIHKKAVRSVLGTCPAAAVSQVTDVLFNCIDCDTNYHLNFYMTSPLLEEEFGNVQLVNHNMVKTDCCPCDGCSTAAGCSTFAAKMVDSINYEQDTQNRFIRAEVLYDSQSTFCLPSVSTCDGIRVGVVTSVTVDGVAVPINGGAGYNVTTQSDLLAAALQTASAGSVRVVQGPDCNCASGEWAIEFAHLPATVITDLIYVAAVECASVTPPAATTIAAPTIVTGLLTANGTTYSCGIRVYGITKNEYYSNCLGLTGDRVSDSVIDVLSFEVQTGNGLGNGYDYSCQMCVVDRCDPVPSKGVGRRLWYEQKSANRDTINPITKRAVTHEIPSPEQDLGVFNVDQSKFYFITGILHENRADFTHGIDAGSHGEITTLVGIPEGEDTTINEWITFANNYFDCVTDLENCPTEFSGSDSGTYL